MLGGASFRRWMCVPLQQCVRCLSTDVPMSSERSSIFLFPSSRYCKTAPIVLGTVKLMERFQRSVGFFRVMEEKARPAHATHCELVRGIFGVDCGIGIDYHGAAQLARGKEKDGLYDQILQNYLKFRTEHDFVIVEGYNHHDFSEAYNYELNMNIARAIGSSVVLVHDVDPSNEGTNTAHDVFQLLIERLELIQQHHADITGVILNRYRWDRASLNAGSEQLLKSVSVPVIGSVPIDGQLLGVEMSDVRHALDARVLVGGEPAAMHKPMSLDDVRVISEHADTVAGRLLSNPWVAYSERKSDVREAVRERLSQGSDDHLTLEQAAEILRELDLGLDSQAVARVVSNLDRDKDGYVNLDDIDAPSLRFLMITGKDRIDLALSLLFLSVSQAYGNILGGMVLAGRGPIGRTASVLSRITSTRSKIVKEINVPILETDLPTFQVIERLKSIETVISKNSSKVERSIQLFESHVQTNMLLEGVKKPVESMSEKMFLHHVQQLAKKAPRRIVLPDASDDRILLASDVVVRKKLAKILLIGNEESIRSRMSSLELDPHEGLEIFDPLSNPKAKEYENIVTESVDVAKAIGGVPENLVVDPYLVSMLLVKAGHADGMVGGIRHATFYMAEAARKILLGSQEHLSTIFFMCLEKEVLVYGDCAINSNPAADLLADIAIKAAEAADRLGIEPRVAMLSYATGDSNKGPEIEKVTEATGIARERRPDLAVFGPTQYDAAVDPRVAKTKVKGESYGVAGRANVLIFPDLNTGNNTYKAVQQATKASAIGPVFLGLDYPISDLSRGATVDDVVNTIVVTAALGR